MLSLSIGFCTRMVAERGPLDETIVDQIKTRSHSFSRLRGVMCVQVIKGGAHRRKGEKQDVQYGDQIRKAEADMEENRLRKESESVPEWDETSGRCKVSVVPCEKNNGHT